MRLAEIPKRAAQRAENETHQTCQPVTGGIQPDRFSAAADAGGDAEHVGERFPEEVRKMHYGEIKKRNIYGDASDAEARDLVEEGINVARIPWVQRHDS